MEKCFYYDMKQLLTIVTGAGLPAGNNCFNEVKP